MTNLINFQRSARFANTLYPEGVLKRLYQRALKRAHTPENYGGEWTKGLILMPSQSINLQTEFDKNSTPQGNIYFLINSLEMIRAYAYGHLDFLNHGTEPMKYSDKWGRMIFNEMRDKSVPFIFPHGQSLLLENKKTYDPTQHGHLCATINNLSLTQIKNKMNAVAHDEQMRKNTYELNVIYRHIIGEEPPAYIPPPSDLPTIKTPVVPSNSVSPTSDKPSPY